jgi:hypothetical protein
LHFLGMIIWYLWPLNSVWTNRLSLNLRIRMLKQGKKNTLLGGRKLLVELYLTYFFNYFLYFTKSLQYIWSIYTMILKIY